MRNIFTALLFSLVLFTQAQNFSFQPNDSLVKTISLDDFSDLTIDIIRNEAIDTLHLEYELLENSLPTNWSVAYCDNHGCWGSLPENGEMSPLYDDINSYIRITINPMGVAGAGVVKYYIYETGLYEQGDIMTYVMNTPNWVGIEELDGSDVKILNNPFGEQLSITTFQKLKSLQIIDLTGKTIISMGEIPEGSIELDTQRLSSGLYFIKTRNKSGSYSIKKIIKGL
jgi:hypothetical protein